MSIFDKITGKGSKGVQCTPNEDGTEKCIVFERKGNQLLATGTTFSMGADPNNSCEPMLVGENRILDTDSEYVNEVGKRKAAGCRKGIA